MKHIDEKNKRIPGKEAVLALMLVGLFLCNSASAASKSASIQVSCTIKPMIELVATSSVRANSNLGHQYQMSESLMDRGAQKMKIYSLTAL